MDPQNNQNPTGSPVVDPNAGVQVPQAEPVVSTPSPTMPSEPVVPAPEPEVPATTPVEPMAMPEPQDPVAPVVPAEGTGDAGIPPTTPPVI